MTRWSPAAPQGPAQLARRSCAALAFGLLTLLAACGGGGGTPEESASPPAVQRAASVDIELSSTTAGVGKSVTMKAMARTQNTAIESYRWILPDGKTLQGQQVSASFATAGKADVTLEAVTTQGTVVKARAAIFVADTQGAVQRALGLPVTPGDVDGVAGLGVRDALVVAQAVSGVQPLGNTGVFDADFDIDARLTSRDLELLMQAVVAGSTMPSALLASSAMPGAVVGMVSPSLLDADARVTVRVDGVNAPPLLRAVPGYASFIVPTTLTRSGSALPVDVLVGDQVVDRFTLSVSAMPTMPADAPADVLQSIEEMRALLQAQEKLLRDHLRAAGVAEADIANAVAPARAGAAQLAKASTDLAALFSGSGGQALARLAQKGLYANGLQQQRSSAKALDDFLAGGDRQRALALTTPEQVCDVLVPAVCGLKRIAELAKSGSEMFSAACSAAAAAVFIGGVVFPADGPLIEGSALAGFVNICLPLATAGEIAAVAGSLFAPVDLALTSSASPTALEIGQTARVRTAVTFVGLQPVCSEFAGNGIQAASTKLLGRRIVGMLLTRNASVSRLAEVFAKVGEAPYAALLTAIQDSVANTLSATGLADALGKVVGSVCPAVTAGEGQIPASRVFSAIPPSDGTLSFNADGTATYSCPAPSAAGPTQAITLNGERKLCGDTAQKTSVSFSCAGSGQVTITMGDNGSLLDDIFEVVVNGATVLTSSTPVRSTSVTLTLPKGRTTVLMRGLAAPDAVGTYFINFTGATVISGRTSGSDLVPGVTKTS
jgi:hypothetical protein